MGEMHTSPHPHTNRHPVLAGLMEAVKIDLILVPAAFVVATICWIVGLGSQLPYSVIPEWAFALWAVVQGLSVSTIGFDFSLAPSLVSLGVWLLVAGAARRLVEGVGDDESETAEERVQWLKTVAITVGSFVLAYAVPLLVLALLVGSATVTPFGFFRMLLFLLTALVTGFIRVRGLEDIPGLRDIDFEVWESGFSLAGRLLWGTLSAAILVVGAGLVLNWNEVADSLQVYSSPTSAGIGLLVLQVLFAPGILFAALSWIAGTGVHLGDAGLSSVFRATAGPVPDIPVLQLLTGEYPGWTMAAPALLVAVGLLSVILGRARAREYMEASWVGLGIAAGVVFVVFETLSLFSTGAMGPFGLTDFGPSALTSAIVLTAWLCLGLCGGLALTKLSDMQSGSGTGDADEVDDEFDYGRDDVGDGSDDGITGSDGRIGFDDRTEVEDD